MLIQIPSFFSLENSGVKRRSPPSPHRLQRMAEKDQRPREEEEKEEESNAESEPEASGDSDDGDDDRDFNIGKGTAKNHIKGLMMVEGTTLRCELC